jgi:biopolymer transport protein ExbB/TolQ
MTGSILKFFQEGGNVMLVNLGVLVLAFSVVAERLYALLLKLRLDEKKFLAAIETFVNAGNFDRAVKLCGEHPGVPAAAVVKSALSAAGSGSQAVAAAIDESILEVKPAVQKRAGILWGIANLATLIGLVGTVFGLVEAFEAIGIAAPDQKSLLLTQGIAHAMNNTAFGLSIAVTCVAFHMVLSNLTKSVMHGVEFSAVRIENILAKRRSEVEKRDSGKARA